MRSMSKNREKGQGVTNLDIAPPVRAQTATAFSEVDLLVGERVVEGGLVANGAGVAMEGDTSKCALSLLHLKIDLSVSKTGRCSQR